MLCTGQQVCVCQTSTEELPCLVLRIIPVLCFILPLLGPPLTAGYRTDQTKKLASSIVLRHPAQTGLTFGAL